MNKDFPSEVCKKFVQFIEALENMENLHEVIILHSGYRIKKFDGKLKGIWSARLNNKYRVHFNVNEYEKLIEIITITILEVNDHQDY